VIKIEQYGYVKGGELKILNRKRMDAEIKAFPDCDVEIIIKKKGKRSTPQNRYYWGVVVYEIKERLKELGHRTDPETVHEFLKQKFNSEKVVIPETAEVIEIGRTTTEMNKEEFNEFIERVREWASATLEIYIPDPGQQTEMFAA
jgi:hypothetical protein